MNPINTSEILTPRGSLPHPHDPLRVVVLGTGQMGAGIARLVLAKQGLALVGAYGRRQERAGMDLGQAIGLNRELGIGIHTDLPAIVEQTPPHVAIQAPVHDSPRPGRRS